MSNDGPLGQPRGILFAILMFIITLSFYSWYWAFKTFDEMQQHTGNGAGGLVGLLIQIVFSPINLFLAPSEVGKMYQGDGQEAPVTGWTGLWNLLPLVGGIIWFVKVQGALNRYWESKSGSAPIAAAA